MIFIFHSIYIIVYHACKVFLKQKSRITKTPETESSIVNSDMETALPGSSQDRSDRTNDLALSKDPIDLGQLHTEEKGLTFNPPAYVQRYTAVIDALKDPRWKDGIKKVVDMGCSELGFFLSLKNFEGIREIVAVDIDIQTLEYYACKTAPLSCDFLKLRENDLVVTVLAGSVAEYDKCLEHSDAVVCIELIEHLYPPELEELPYTILGQVKPKVAIFTTPNADFNVLFPNFGPGFRHPDHKFEWSREQFEDWANSLTKLYPEYQVEFRGIAAGPDDTEKTYGCCSQMALFWRDHFPEKEPLEIPPSADGPPHKVVQHSEYKIVRRSVYPARRDERPPELKARHEAEYHLHSLSRLEQYEDDSGEIFIPLTDLLPRVKSHFSSLNELRSSLAEAGRAFKVFADGSVSVRYLNRETSSDEESFHDEDEVRPEEWNAHAPEEIWDADDSWPKQNGTSFSNGRKSPASPDSDWEMGEATPRPWQSEPQLQASSSSPQHEGQNPPESVMFRSVNERQIFGFRGMVSSPFDAIRVDDSGYPNSASVQDMDVTLGSSDELSTAEDEDEEEDDDIHVPQLPPPPVHFDPAAMPANNHDAVNNNRDYEGNDLGLEVPHQPQPRPRPPPFPRWLLLVLAEERDPDEGFEAGSSSSEEEDDDRH